MVLRCTLRYEKTLKHKFLAKFFNLLMRSVIPPDEVVWLKMI